MFQRQYVWTKESQWQLLWEDIERKFTDYLEGRRDAPVHFLGAMVLDQKMTPAMHVVMHQVIDGQQRLTTFQLFLAAFRDFCAANDCPELAKECDRFTLNTGMMSDPATDKFKVWPTQLDRGQFADVMEAYSCKALEVKHPRVRKKYAREDDPRPRMVEAYLFFYREISGFLLGIGQEPPLIADQPLASRAEECFQSLKNALQVVVIDLEQGDDAQVIFETLNARGEPLLPADLLRNYIFLQAARANEAPEKLYSQYWQQFDEDFWRKPIVQGRLERPRSDLFLQHFLASQLTRDIPAKQLFSEYKYWSKGGESHQRQFATVEAELALLARQRESFRRLLEPANSDVLYRLATFLKRFDSSTVYPLLLHLLEDGLTDEQWQTVSRVIESYFVRRVVCGWTAKNYNHIFLSLTRLFRREEFSIDGLLTYLTTMSGDSAGWPTDAVFRMAWMDRAAYWYIWPQARLVWILLRLNEKYLTSRSETITVQSEGLTIEHLMPQSWQEHWPLPTGEASPSQDTPHPDESASKLMDEREGRIQTVGNLTLLTQPLNSRVSNGPWSDKRPEILEASLLPLNLQLANILSWNEQAIAARSAALFEKALEVWPRA